MDKELTYHFTGIKGTGMSALARVLKGSGYQVQGSDVTDHFFTEEGLKEAGITVLPFDPDNIHEGMTVICGNAFKDDHPEVVRAKELGLTVTRYHYFLGELIKKYTSVAITGSHGKTSTTGLMAHVLGSLKTTSYLIGDGTGKGVEDGEYFVLEADEYREHFLAYEPDYAIFTNIDFDHPDFYHNIEEVFAANRKFAHQVKNKVIAYGDDPYLQKLKDEVDVWYYGIDNDDFDIVAKDIVRNTKGSHFDVWVQGKHYGNFSIHTFGQHSILNSLAVIGFCYLEGFAPEDVQEALTSFKGVKRRFNERFVEDMVIVDDYAHHPSEIKATIDAARQQYPDKAVISVFQPHTYSRTLALLDQFAEALDKSDAAFVCDIFASARETDHHQVSSQDVLDRLTVPHAALDLGDMTSLLAYKDAVILFMGAGDVPKYAKAYEAALLENGHTDKELSDDDH
ncbi:MULTISPECIES: UDP-N-acetylmuramate--L-alanine ligase [Aerococcus]|uniref:UDP-N-acetylmuramate--L-alanine ligase n=1 Tax=Aerococcus TaxID=1375 RepID=UPI0018A6D66B|nr:MULTISPECIES: UDP-N-acetylmuramate--L-alanine ligase [Aerococcus]MCY3036396.1 UDP-N-acetylmuramate--L-alanine ligase [Aerococcus sp. Group 2]MCY3039358.1 UDP-N-acetylmuramate--L-alanine ligase [Aerococcus sp. Group 2]MCY3041260.1 UDP-N-acetylmuramate--L-alanine ligase [Aerococcus sp. Group 2]MCY3042812.1 UDP-N-acetylmuramate--L-alanine ligase [Aerococcus sp. Group 2]MDK6520826.1 UDP-N-acetylmuramate--L-alanine ligase [Aerococcus urinae]